MRIEVFRDASVYDAVPPEEWNALLTRATTNVIFLTWQWQSTWWRYLGDGELLVIVCRDGAGDLQAIAPLFRSRSENGMWTLSITGCEDVSDYLDFVVPPAHEEAICEELLTFLTSEQAPGWDNMLLCNLPSGSTAWRVLADKAERMSLDVGRRIQDRCPVIRLPADWKQYLASLSKKQRHEIRRKLRRAENQVSMKWYKVGPQVRDLSEAMDAFIDLHRMSSTEKRVFMDARMKGFFLEMAQIVGDQRWLHLSFVEVNGQKAAGMLSFDYNNEFQVYNSGYDVERFAYLSPGIVLTAHAIRQAIEQGRSTFDFLRGEEEYKYRMGAVPTDVFELRITRSPSN